MLTRTQVAAELNVSRDTVTRMVNDGDLIAHAIGGTHRRQLRFRREDLDAYLEQTRTFGRGTRRFRLTPTTSSKEADRWQSINARRNLASAAGR
jgi:excisionase family DNA binding protein